ncbi:MAG: carbon-nitrogen family hydrolase [Acutalibacteraceae bacterium]|nr:carbon-nitrogen family hydrolase [Acutalibacteraceae bacterium]
MKVALFQMNIEWENKDKNFEKIESVILSAKEQGAQVLFLPEMTFTGFSMNINITAESDRYTVERMKSVCKKYGLAVGFGWTEKCGEKAKNCYTVIDKNGNELSTYVKIHPFSYAGEDNYFIKGDKIITFDIDETTFSNVICYDTRFPELFQAISKDERVKAIVIPANWPAKRAEHWKSLVKARAIENQTYIIAVNCVGEIGGNNYSGDSCVITPDGQVQAMVSNQETLVCVELDCDVDSLRKNFPVKKDRQIDFYKSIL